MKVKTSDLIGPALNWAVGKCKPSKYGDVVFDPKTKRVYETEGLRHIGVNFEPTTSWNHGGPIIEKDVILFQSCGEAGLLAYFKHRGTCGVTAVGPTHLIAAMRLKVMSELGDEIEVPEELLK